MDVCPQNEASDPSRGQDHPAASNLEDIDQVVDRPLEVNHDQVLNARTLFEKVNRFRTSTKDSTIVRTLYAIQTILQGVASFSALLGNMLSYKHIVNVVNCNTDELISVDHKFFRCYDNLAPFYRAALSFFNCLLFLYVGTCVYTWLSFRQYSFNCLMYSCRTAFCKSFQSYRGIMPAENDLAFLVQLLGQCNKLFIDRFSVFLDESLEEALKVLLHYRPVPIPRELFKDKEEEF